MDNLLLIAGGNDAVMADFVAHRRALGTRRLAVIAGSDTCLRLRSEAVTHSADNFSREEFLAAHGCNTDLAVVLFLRRRSARNRSVIDAVAQIVAANKVKCLCIVSTFLVHFGDRRATQAEVDALNRLREVQSLTVVLRPSHVLCQQSGTMRLLRRFGWCYPLVPKRLSSCLIDGQELRSVIDLELQKPGRRRCRTMTILGPNAPWAAALREHCGRGLRHRLQTAFATALSWLLIGQIFGWFVAAMGLFVAPLRSWNFQTLRPTSTGELLALYNRHNFRRIKVVGYNNGVIHFGQRHPGRTIVSTVGCNQIARVNSTTATFDAGVTIRQAMDVLSRAGKELYVLPNYSFVSLGTAFFVPIHGSASEFSTVGDTVESVLLFDPVMDRFVATKRGQPAFGDYFYNLERDVLLLRLTIRVKAKTRYFMAQQTVNAPASDELLAAFRDGRPSNVEVRKSKASRQTADVYRYYTRDNGGGALEFPRDRVGRLWDIIETNRVSAALFHAFMRRFGYHVEMFLSPDEFAAFWKSHRRLPIAKIQLRYIKRDAFPHSPFREHDCVSADLFMLRKHKREFESYVKTTLPSTRFNPGKHSM